MAPVYPLLNKAMELSCHRHSPSDYVLHFFTLTIRCFLNFASEITYLKQVSLKPLFPYISLSLPCGLVFHFPLVMFVLILEMNKLTKPQVFQVAYFVLEPSGKLALQKNNLNSNIKDGIESNRNFQYTHKNIYTLC